MKAAVSIRSTADFLFLSGDKRYTWLMLVVTAAVFCFLSRNHSFVPMWVEGMGECIHVELRMLGYDKEPITCALRVGSLSLPLSMNSHIGPAWYYVYAPTLYLWFKQATKDPYLYRYSGILLFLINGWLFFWVLKKYYKPVLSFYSAVVFSTSPLLLLGTLTDYELEQTMLALILLTALLFSIFLSSGRTTLLLASAIMLGLNLLTRTEVVIWLMVPFAVYLVLSGRSMVLDRLKNVKHKLAVSLGALGMFCLGASPVIAYNVICPRLNVFSFAANQVLAPAFGTSSPSPWRSFAVRIGQFWNFNLLNIWPMYELRIANYAMGALWLTAFSIIAVRSFRRRHPGFPLVVVPTVLALSILTSSSLKSEHLIIVQPAAFLVITSAFASVEKFTSLRRVVHVAFILLIAGNLAVAALDWRSWNEQSANVQTMLNQSDPVLLSRYLSERHANDRILYTNVGLNEYVRYMTAGRIGGEDIMDWTGVSGFVTAVKQSLLDKTRNRVFVAVARQHDGLGGATSRTKLLYSILDQYDVPYRVSYLSTDRNQHLYEMITVSAGVRLGENASMDETIFVSDVVDVRVARQSGGDSVIVGSILGTGFKPGDVAYINGGLMASTVYGNDSWVTFSFPLEAVANESSFRLEVIRVQSMVRSRTLNVNFSQ